MEIDFEKWRELPSLADVDAKELAEVASGILDAKKANNLSVLHVTDKSDITDYLVLATATSSTHVKALAGELTYRLGQRGVDPLHEDGRGTGSWQIVDFGTVIVHIFDREARDYYNLDKLYRNTEEIERDNGAREEEKEK